MKTKINKRMQFKRGTVGGKLKINSINSFCENLN